jgi:hypothetical protein
MPTLENQVGSLEPIWWKKKADFHKLYSDLNTYCGTHSPTHMYIHPKHIRNPPSYTHYMTSASSPSLELLGTQRVGNVLNGVTQTMCVVIGGVDAPVEQKH